jgi:hypothetical protein
MPTVREVTFELFRAHEMTPTFRNSGSTAAGMWAA